MKEQILDLEADFSNNEYFGTNVWTEEKYRVLSGKIPVLLSAPHSVNQLRGEEVRPAEKFTGALARYLSNLTDSYAIFQLFTHADPNNDENHNYKNAVINIVETYNIKLLIDIHSTSFKDDSDIDVVTNLRGTLGKELQLVDKLKLIGLKNDVVIDENNKPNKEVQCEIISVVSLVCGIPAMRIILNSNKIDLEKDSAALQKICDAIEEFISLYKNV